MEERFYVTPEDYIIAEKNGLTRKDVYRRVFELNWSIERAITEPKMVMSPKIVYTEEERVLMAKNNISVKNVTQRIKEGWERERAVNTPRRGYRRSEV